MNSKNHRILSMHGKGHWESYTSVDGLVGGNIVSMIVDKSGYLWIAKGGDGVSRYDGEGFRNFTVDDGLPNNFVNEIFEDTKGNLWFATGGGVCRYNGESFEPPLSVRDGLVNDYVRSITEDTKGNLWFGTWGSGIRKYDDRIISYPTGVIKSAIEDSSGDLWFTEENGTVIRYTGHIFQQVAINAGKVVKTMLGQNGNLWFGGTGCITRYDGNSFQMIQDIGLEEREVHPILEDTKGNLWLDVRSSEDSANTSKIAKFDGKNFHYFPDEGDLPANLMVESIEDKIENIWFSTVSEGVTNFQ